MIAVEDIHFTYRGGVDALRGVSLTIEDGEFVAIMGPNGAGKTTLVKHFNGLLKPTKGRVLVDEVDTRKTSVAKLARDVGFVFQNPDNQLFSETVEEEIAFALRNFGFKKNTLLKRVTWALNLLGLTEYRKTSPFMLSGGERKRVALASVLAWDPKVVVLDEPTIGQDYKQKEKLRQFIIQLNTQGKTVVVVTHDVEFVADSNPRIILMAEGEIIADDNASDVLTNVGVLTKASIIPPQVTQIFMGLSEYGLPSDVIDLSVAKEILKERMCDK
jgi:energy-coupling factor transport system ATP-binding protein